MDYQNEEDLRKLYLDKGLSQTDIANKFNVDQTTISNWINKHDIKKPLKNPELLREMYWEDDMSLQEIANEIDSYRGSVGKAMERHGIDNRKSTTEKFPHFSQADSYGHEVWRHTVDGTQHGVRVHRLACVAEYGIEEVKGMDVHHVNCVPWDNRPENYKLMTRSQHSQHHANEQNRTND